jgi:perosamine synthetase
MNSNALQLDHRLPKIARNAPESSFIPLCAPEIRGNEWNYVKECLDTAWVSTVGSFVDRFERSVADAVGALYAVATNSGTSALHVALLAAGVEPDDEVLVSTLTFIAPANAIRYSRAWPVFVDASIDHWQMDAHKAEEFLTEQCQWRDGALRNRITGRRVRAILPVHILGHPVEMDSILALARRFKLAVIEDATESLGAEYRDKPVGHLGDIACFSFNGNKLITTGGGGMIVTDNAEMARRARHLTTQAKDDPLEYVHSEIGYNYRLTNIQAAMGVAQMEQLATYLRLKRSIAHTYNHAFRHLAGLTPLREASWARSACWMYTILIDEQEFGTDSRTLLHELGERDIQSRPLWQPLHLSKAHTGAATTDCSVSEELNLKALSLPCSVGLTKEAQERVIDAVAEIHAAKGRQPRASRAGSTSAQMRTR